MKCYFCNLSLTSFINCNVSLTSFTNKDNTGNHYNHYCCNNCQPILKPLYNGSNIWKSPYYIIINESLKINASYLYFNKIKLWLHIHYRDNNSFMDIKNEDNCFILRLKNVLNPFDYHPDFLANRIKNWILYS